MRPGKLLRALVVITFGILLLALPLPGANPIAKLAIGASLVTLGALQILLPLTAWFLFKTTRPEDYQGECPVGRSCPDCGTFAFYPRNECKSCGRDLTGVTTVRRDDVESYGSTWVEER